MHPRLRIAGGITCWVVAAALCQGLWPDSASPSSDTVESRTFRFIYTVVVDEIPEDAQMLSVWIPVPQSDRWQIVHDVKVTAPSAYTFTREKRYGNSLIYFPAYAPLPSDLELRLETVIERRAFNVISGERKSPGTEEPAAHDLEPHEYVPIDGDIAELARGATDGFTTQLEKARAIYDYVIETMSYDKSGEGWGRGDALYACDTRRGNCTDFHSLLIGMARACGIPARFVIGFPLPGDRVEGEIPGYHCWAEMYIEDVGWVPVDASEAGKHPEKREVLFGGLDADRVQFTSGRDLQLEPEASEIMNYFVYPHVELDGVTHSGVRCSFSFVEVES